jgi:rubredoxin
MVEIPELGDISDAQDAGRTLLPWLEDPHECPTCGVYCTLSSTFDPQLVEPVKSWECPECLQHYRREAE